MCIINNSRKFVFVHVPKCAGTTVSKFYSGFSKCIDIEIGATEIGEKLQPYYIKKYGISKHSTFDEIHGAIGPEHLRQYFVFGFSRNPYDRIISIFTFLRKWSGWEGHGELKKIDNINDFIHSPFFHADGPDRIMKPQIFWLKQNNFLDHPKEIFIGRMEDLDASINHINSRLNLPIEKIKLGHANSSKDDPINKNTITALSRESKDLINLRYDADFISFGYALE